MCVNVGTEYGIVLLSTVRSMQCTAQDSSETADTDWIRKNLGFVADPHRICVGITRCKFGLVIVGELIRESVDSLCRDAADMPMPPYIRKAFQPPQCCIF